ncbi:hypothetical protein [Aurantimonas sp. Leaf443]|uniref:hypothetical protein n=1 Tax=Aurantimonas sp. Leaf443 TaxID=1736378 RepID=UPI000700D700|nr:hypothetical protein [Aurantimonas sp. Leaf443]KQT85588.1 hypothetical protein ASG48_10300 [Aurantimonas sp. Leaf443]
MKPPRFVTVTLELPDEVLRFLEATSDDIEATMSGILATAVCDRMDNDLTEAEWHAARDEQERQIAEHGVIPF